MKARNPPKIGERFSRLVIIGEAKPSAASGRRVTVICDCGKRFDVLASSLRALNTKSCGCLRDEKSAERGRLSRKHGHTRGNRTPEYWAWVHMKQRCYEPSQDSYPRYGGRGITVCSEWLQSFEAFYAYVGTRPSNKHQLDRIDNDKNYEPGNVKWSTPQENSKNRSSTRWIEVEGEKRTLTEWIRALGISFSGFYRRKALGLSDAEALVSKRYKPRKIRS